MAATTTMPPLPWLYGAAGGFPHGLAFRGASTVALPRAGTTGTLVHWTKWRKAKRWSSQPLTTVHTHVPELIGRIGPFQVSVVPAGVVPYAVFGRDAPLMRAIVAEGVSTTVEHGPLAVRTDARSSLRVRFQAGHLTAHFGGELTDADEIGHLIACADAGAAAVRTVKARGGLPPARPVDAHFEPAAPSAVEPGAADVEEIHAEMEGRVAAWLGITEDLQATWAAFAASYAEHRGYRPERRDHGEDELRVYGVELPACVSVLGDLPDGRPLRLAHVQGPAAIPPGEGRQERYVPGAHDLALAGPLAPPELERLARHRIPDARLRAEYLQVGRTADRITAAGLDAVRDRAAELLAWASGGA